MSIKVGINGFGRIGRLAFRVIKEFDGIEVVAVNDLTNAETLAHLVKYDTVHGRYQGTIENTDGGFIADGDKVAVYNEKEPKSIPWKDHNVDIVLEATGFFTTKDKASAHLEGGAKKVLVTAPGSDDIKMAIFGVNEDILDGSEDVISTGSCTTNSLAPVAKALNDAYGINTGLMTTVHAYTGDQNLQDGPHSKLTRARAAAQNIVPTSTGAAKAIGKVIPEIDGKLDGTAQRVPVIDGSVTELTVTLNKKVTEEGINELMKSRQDESFGYNEDPIVSSDIIGITYGSLFDATQTKVLNVGDEQLVRVVAWYDNEMGFVHQMIRVLNYFMNLK